METSQLLVKAAKFRPMLGTQLPVLPKALYSFGREVGAKGLERPTPLQVSELLLFLAARREAIA